MSEHSAVRIDRVSLVEVVRLALREDVGSGDVTTASALPGDARATARIVVKAAGIVAGLEAVREVYRQTDAAVRVEAAVSDGAAVAPGDVIATVRGPARSILTGERVALNLLGHLSGVATLTARFVEAVAETKAKIVDTRKTTPGLRALEKAAVRAGGGVNHRFGLDDAVLVKTNHVRAGGGWARALEAVREGKRLGLPTEVEVARLEEIAGVLEALPDRILLDNLSPAEVREAVARIRATEPPRIAIEASGGVTLSTVGELARAGVDWISVGALTHSAPSLDVALRVEPAD